MFSASMASYGMKVIFFSVVLQFVKNANDA